jgi:hypothetical protein
MACEPDCGIAGYVEPACGIEPDCGIAQPCGGGCGVFAGGCGGACGGVCGGYGYGLFGLFNGWGPDWEVTAKGWNPCLGPFEALADAFRCCGWGWGWGAGCGWGFPHAGCGSCYWDEWISDPPRCCDPCPNPCASSGCGVGAGCGDCGGGYCASQPQRQGASYAQNFHPWPRKATQRNVKARQIAGSGRTQARSPMQRICNCPKCQAQRKVAGRQVNSNLRQVNYQR